MGSGIRSGTKMYRGPFVDAAVRLVTGYFGPHSRAALRQIGLSERHANARRVLKWVRAHRKAEVSREEIRREALGQTLDAVLMLRTWWRASTATSRYVWRGIRREEGRARPVTKKAPLMTATLRRAIHALPDSLIGARDRALLLIGLYIRADSDRFHA
jgi:hypothetical protein